MNGAVWIVSTKSSMKHRKQIAKQRNRDPVVAAAITSLGVILACLAPIALAICLLRTTHSHESTDTELSRTVAPGDGLRQTCSTSVLLVKGRRRLEHDSEPAKLLAASEDDLGQTEHSPA